jgi:hypothetical protein
VCLNDSHHISHKYFFNSNISMNKQKTQFFVEGLGFMFSKKN